MSKALKPLEHYLKVEAELKVSSNENTSIKIPEIWYLNPYCIVCDNPLEEKEEVFIHPDYEDEIVCEHCHSTILNQPRDEFNNHIEVVEPGAWPCDWMIDEDEDEFYDHEE